MKVYYIIPSDNWEQQQSYQWMNAESIISYQAITGNNNNVIKLCHCGKIISYQAITGNNNLLLCPVTTSLIISYQAITGNNNTSDIE